MTLDLVVYCLLMMFVWLGIVPLLTKDNVRVAENDAWKALLVMFAFWLLQELLRRFLSPLAPHPVWTWTHPYQYSYPYGAHDVSFLLFSVLVAGLAIWLIGRVRHFALLRVTHFGWAVAAAAVVLFCSYLVERFGLPILMPHINHFVDSLR